MWLTRTFIIAGAVALIAFFVWPWFTSLDMSGHMTFRAGSFSAEIPAVMGIFATMGLAAMLFAVKR
ncbi:MAG: hypothetical protein ACM3YN_09015 [Parcubacteria group bacterium]